MKTTIHLALLLFLLGCNKNPKVTANLPTINIAAKNFAADSIAKWTKNILPMPTDIKSDTVNFTDANNLKQGKWIIFTGKEVKTEYYKNGKLIEGC